MGIIIRQSIKNSLVSYVGVVIGVVNVLWLTPLYLSKSEIGVARYMLVFGLLLAQLAQLGTSQMAVRFFTYFKDETQQYKGFFGFLLLFPFLGFLVVAAAYVGLKPVFVSVYQGKSPELIRYYFHFLPLVFFLVYMSVLEAYSRVHLRIVVPALVRELFLKTANALLILAYGLGYIDFSQLVACLVGAYGLAVVFLLVYIKILGRLYLRLDFAFVRTPVFREMLTYGFFVILGGVGTMLATEIATLMLPAYKGGLEATGIYALAFNIAVVIEIPRRAITQISTPLVADAWRRNDLAHIKDLYRKSSLNQLIVGCLLFLGVWCNIDDIFALIPNGETFKAGKWVVFVVALSRLTDMATGINSEIVLNSKYYRFDLFAMMLLAFLTATVNSILIPRYQIIGAALGTLFSVGAYNVIRTVFLWVTFRLQPFTQKTLLVILIAAVTFLAVNFLPLPSGGLVQTLVSLTVRSVLIAAVFGFLILWLRVSSDINQLLGGLLGKLKAMQKKS